MTITILPTDKAFLFSPDAGHPDCRCSRCNVHIQELESPVRMWTVNEKGEAHEHSREYRYCDKCMATMGIELTLVPNDFDLYEGLEPEFEQTCRICGCTNDDACFHPKHFNCWWVEPDLCSHCYHWPGEAIRYSKMEDNAD